MVNINQPQIVKYKIRRIHHQSNILFLFFFLFWLNNVTYSNNVIWAMIKLIFEREPEIYWK